VHDIGDPHTEPLDHAQVMTQLDAACTAFAAAARTVLCAPAPPVMPAE
jgi:hypothetical protein